MADRLFWLQQKSCYAYRAKGRCGAEQSELAEVTDREPLSMRSASFISGTCISCASCGGLWLLLPMDQQPIKKHVRSGNPAQAGIWLVLVPPMLAVVLVQRSRSSQTPRKLHSLI